MGNISEPMRDAATEVVRRAITSGKAHPLSPQVAKRFHENGWVESLACSGCDLPVLDDEELGFPHLHTFSSDCAAPVPERTDERPKYRSQLWNP